MYLYNVHEGSDRWYPVCRDMCPAVRIFDGCCYAASNSARGRRTVNIFWRLTASNSAIIPQALFVALQNSGYRKFNRENSLFRSLLSFPSRRVGTFDVLCWLLSTNVRSTYLDSWYLTYLRHVVVFILTEKSNFPLAIDKTRWNVVSLSKESSTPVVRKDEGRRV